MVRTRAGVQLGITRQGRDGALSDVQDTLVRSVGNAPKGACLPAWQRPGLAVGAGDGKAPVHARLDLGTTRSAGAIVLSVKLLVGRGDERNRIGSEPALFG